MSEVFIALDAAFVATMTAAAAAIPLAAVVLLIDAAVGRRMAPTLRHAMWLVVVIRLLIPYAPASPVAISQLWGLVIPSQEVGAQEFLGPLSIQGYATDHVAGEEVFSARYDSARPQSVTTPSDATRPTDDPVAMVVWLIWAAGVFVVLMRAVVTTTRFAGRLRRCEPIATGPLAATLDEVCRAIGVKSPALKIVPSLGSPALFGWWRPTICLPEESVNYTGSELRAVLKHELAHLRRGDALTCWLLTVVGAVHWFNPVAWLATGRVAGCAELACDEAACDAGHDERRAYAELLLRIAASRRPAPLGLVGLWFSRPSRRMSKRIAAIAHSATRPRWMSPVALALVLSLAIGGWTDATSAKAVRETPATLPGLLAIDPHSPGLIPLYTGPIAAQPSNDGPKEVRTYDVSAALEQMRKMKPSANASEWLKLYPWGMSGEKKLDLQVDGEEWSLQLTPSQHKSFAQLLDAFSKSGPWQVFVETRVIRAPGFEVLGDVDWDTAIRYPSANEVTNPVSASPLRSDSDAQHFSSQTTSRQFAPYLATVLPKAEAMRLFAELLPLTEVKRQQAPKVTVFNGNQAALQDASVSPFVVGVDLIKGKYGTAVQPRIARLPKGLYIGVRPVVVDETAVDLACQLTVTEIAGTKNIKLPMKDRDVTVQAPEAKSRTIHAHSRLAPGDVLLVAPTLEVGKDGVVLYAISAEWMSDIGNAP